MNSKALALDPNYAGAHAEEGNILATKGRINDAVAENERPLALDPAMVDGCFDYQVLGQFEKSPGESGEGIHAAMRLAR